MKKQRNRCFLIVSLLMGAIIILNGCAKKQNDASLSKSQSLVINFQSATANLDATFKDFAEVRDEPANTEKYQEILERMKMFLITEGKKNTPYLQTLLEDIVRAIADVGPGMALQLQDYANKELKLEMERLKNSSNVLALAEKNKQIAELQKEIDALKQNIVSKEKELNELKEKILPPSQGVPVILINTYTSDSAYLRIINNDTKQTWFVESVMVGQPKIINLPPGGYTVESTTSSGGVTYASEKITVFNQPKFYHKNKWYYGEIFSRVFSRD